MSLGHFKLKGHRIQFLTRQNKDWNSRMWTMQYSTRALLGTAVQSKSSGAKQSGAKAKQARDLSKVLSMPMCSQWTFSNNFDQKYIKPFCLLNFCNMVGLDQITSKCLVCCHLQHQNQCMYRVRQLILMHFRQTFFHDLMTL